MWVKLLVSVLASVLGTSDMKTQTDPTKFTGNTILAELAGGNIEWTNPTTFPFLIAGGSGWGKLNADYYAAMLSFEIPLLTRGMCGKVTLSIRAGATIQAVGGVYLCVVPDYTNDADTNWTYDTLGGQELVESSTILQLSNNQSWVQHIWYSYDITEIFNNWKTASNYPTNTKFNFFIVYPNATSPDVYSCYFGVVLSRVPYIKFSGFKQVGVQLPLVTNELTVQPMNWTN